MAALQHCSVAAWQHGRIAQTESLLNRVHRKRAPQAARQRRPQSPPLSNRATKLPTNFLAASAQLSSFSPISWRLAHRRSRLRYIVPARRSACFRTGSLQHLNGAVLAVSVAFPRRLGSRVRFAPLPDRDQAYEVQRGCVDDRVRTLETVEPVLLFCCCKCANGMENRRGSLPASRPCGLHLHWA